ncbi:hypothetical protein BASA50_008188 [Batrachochytrium salamandrivorans]|uniref:Core domain-containing protein n=1 Tax=Batrachochytrium salamandrivorans TaxID=1357716 RepID=A0ABQ8F4U5_9FUNG|nr:hypothetical protein BASA50_008188 [Batrachochytrium salamandrivorans]
MTTMVRPSVVYAASLATSTSLTSLAVAHIARHLRLRIASLYNWAACPHRRQHKWMAATCPGHIPSHPRYTRAFTMRGGLALTLSPVGLAALPLTRRYYYNNRVWLGARSMHTDKKPQVQVSDRAAKRINDINLKDGTQMALRVLVDSGGCHGFQYKLELTAEPQPDDIIFENGGAQILVDTMSLDMLDGSTIDFVDELIGSSFQVVGNPNAETSCGCKTSFNLK